MRNCIQRLRAHQPLRYAPLPIRAVQTGQAIVQQQQDMKNL
jgi:hypothetical protein